MTLIEKIRFQLSQQKKALTDSIFWDAAPFCKNAEYYYYYAMLMQVQPAIITLSGPNSKLVRCFLKSKTPSFYYGDPTFVVLEGPCAGILGERDGNETVFRRYLLDTCTRIPEENETANYLTNLAPHAYIDAFISQLQRKGVECDAKQMKQNSLTYSAWIRSNSKKKL